MLMKSFTIWAPNEHLRKFIERLLFKNHMEAFLWPDRLPAHKRWIEMRESSETAKYAYIPSTSTSEFEALQQLDVTSVFVISENHLPAIVPHHDILVSGANSCSACKKAVKFIANQLHAVPSHRSRLIVLPSPKLVNRGIIRP
jgi:hypothetical protein